MGEPPPSSIPVPPPSSIPVDTAEQADVAQSVATTAADLRGAADDRPISNTENAVRGGELWERTGRCEESKGDESRQLLLVGLEGVPLHRPN
eukprot:6347187-Prymnesium_polylepis.1